MDSTAWEHKAQRPLSWSPWCCRRLEVKHRPRRFFNPARKFAHTKGRTWDLGGATRVP
jgi:hypothetical protein